MNIQYYLEIKLIVLQIQNLRFWHRISLLVRPKEVIILIQRKKSNLILLLRNCILDVYNKTECLNMHDLFLSDFCDIYSYKE